MLRREIVSTGRHGGLKSRRAACDSPLVLRSPTLGGGRREQESGSGKNERAGVLQKWTGGLVGGGAWRRKLMERQRDEGTRKHTRVCSNLGDKQTPYHGKCALPGFTKGGVGPPLEGVCAKTLHCWKNALCDVTKGHRILSRVKSCDRSLHFQTTSRS